ncbi:AAA family ATPase [Cryobacterium zhongshanensis]|uniref:Nuclease SbcCD subunit C n=1 Tax=Cryobacterium zhongshanensis TaxID=2928153 RepID=A0AA41QT48_9MICO|nr:AAA family ATPase [Cryobacterium zhongshanensis]MCI4656999.1 AAA family ATPase [Cryobacterium zhongshanensis]
MKIKRLRLAGFGPFKNEQVVDFESFDDDGIFLITGKTGAGKSSILDAVCFALYGSVPRYEGTESQLRSDHCEPGDPTFVELEFGLNGHDYRIFRTPKYLKAKKRGVGTTPSAPDARLEIRDLDAGAGGGAVDGWRGIAARPVDVGNELARILPLKQDQFLQVILLAQNRFQRFLLAKTDDRREVLRTLFGTSRFQSLETELITRRKALDDELTGVRVRLDSLAAAAARHLRVDAGSGTIAPDPASFDAAVAELEQALAIAVAAAAGADAALIDATAGVRTEEELRARQDRKVAAAATLALLDDRSAAVDVDREDLAVAHRAARVWPQIETEAAALASALDAARAEAAARENWLAIHGSDAEDQHGDDKYGDDQETVPLSTTIDLLLEQLGSLNDVLAAEEELPALAAEILVAETGLANAQSALDELQARIDAAPAQLDDLDRDLAVLARDAALEPEAVAALARTEAADAAAAEAAALESDLDAARGRHAAAAAGNADAAGHYRNLVAKRLADHAGELAGRLVAGQPCGVCGSPVHPHPAAAPGEPVTEADIEDALADMTRAQDDLERSNGDVLTLGARAAAARAAAGPGTETDRAASRADALTALESARSAAGRETELGAERLRLRTELDHARATLAGAHSGRDEAATRLTELRGRRIAIEERVDRHSAGYASITERAESLRVELESARTLQAARALSGERERALDAASAAVAGRLTAEGFAEEAEVVAARLTPAEIAAREAGIRSHDDQLAAVRAVLAEPELADLPDAALDLEPAKAALAAAAEARDEAFAVQGTLAVRREELAVVVTEARALIATSATLLVTQTQVRELAAVVHGEEPNTKRMKLETYVLAAQLEEIILAANGRLRDMTGGRYALEHDDSLQYRGTQSGLGLAILDQHTGRARPTQSLSGGETFLASLALALGLAEVVSHQAGGIALDTLFVDEGFGSLDSETLETAMSTLDGLRAGGRTIGLISHVDSMKEQIPAKLAVTVTDQGFSEIASTALV